VGAGANFPISFEGEDEETPRSWFVGEEFYVSASRVAELRVIGSLCSEGGFVEGFVRLESLSVDWVWKGRYS
jgi:hypothetical protein